MKTRADLIAGVDSFTLLDLLRKVASHKGLRLCEGASRAFSEPIRIYTLDARLLAALAERGIKQQDRPDCNNRIFTLVDENPQDKVPGWAPSNYWNFKLLEEGGNTFDLRVELRAGLGLSTKKPGVVFVPRAYGSLVSAVDSLPNLRMFRALVESDKDAPLVAQEIAASDGDLVVTWDELGLNGIKAMARLFAEFASGNQHVTRLGREGLVFDPVPEPRYNQPGDEIFISKPAQDRLWERWRGQLEKYRESLVV